MKTTPKKPVTYIVGRFNREEGKVVRVIRLTPYKNRLGITVKREEIFRKEWEKVMEKFVRVSGPFTSREAARAAKKAWEGKK